MTKPSSIAKQAADLILLRDAAGQAKYGVSMDRDDLTPTQWIQHAIEEHADALQYLLKLRGDIEAVVRAAYRRGRNDALDAAIANYDCGELAVIEYREDEDAEAGVIEDLLG